MRDTTYWLVVGSGVAVCWLLTALRWRGKKALPLLGMPLAVLLGLLCAKTGYVVLMAQRQLFGLGLESFLRWNKIEHYSVICGGIGLCLGVALAARLLRVRPATALDAFAPGGAILLAAVRLGEYFCGTLGIGRYPLDPAGPFARFPFGHPNSWGEWFPAVFMLEALLALLCAAGVLLWRARPRWRTPGVTFEVTAFFLLLPQIFCESLRATSMKWGFVRAEQVLCGVLLLALIWYACRRSPEKGFWRKYWPCFGHLACVALVVWVELALDKWSTWPDWANYLLMLVALAGMALCERQALVSGAEKEAA